jgi:hypothetical protein
MTTTSKRYKGDRYIRRNVDGLHDYEARRLGTYHTGVPTTVVSARIPSDKASLARDVLKGRGLNMAEWIERMIDTELLRERA